MSFDELADLQILRASEVRLFSTSPRSSEGLDSEETEFPWSGEDLARQVRLRLRLLLALHNEGQGTELSKLALRYKMMFSQSLDLQTLGFSSIEAMANCWDDVIQQKPAQPGWAFSVDTAENRRVLNTVATGLRSAIFTILLAKYPDGLSPLDLVHTLEQSLSSKLWEILSANAYLFDDVNMTQEVLSNESNDFQLADCRELKLLLHDMDDFVRYGCREDGTLVVKLRDGDFPLLDLLDCDAAIAPGDGNSPPPNSSEASTSQEVSSRLASLLTHPKTGDPGSSPLCTSESDSPFSRRQSYDVQIKGESEEIAQAPFLRNVKKLPRSWLPPPRLEHEIRLILGSQDFIELGVPIETFLSVYKQKTGHALDLGQYETLQVLAEALPEVIDQDVLSSQNRMKLVQSPKNMRLLSTTKAGLRQVLFWALLKNPGGIWAELLEGWYQDFAGTTLSSTLSRHGYEKRQSSPLFPVFQFLRDMSDILKPHPQDPRISLWDGNLEDPVIEDATLINLPPETIQYDPLREDYENTRSSANLSLHMASSGSSGIFDDDVDEEHSDCEKDLNSSKDNEKTNEHLNYPKDHAYSASSEDLSDNRKECAVLRCMVTPHAKVTDEKVL